MTPPNPSPLDAVCVSDLHLGSDNCQARSLSHFLAALRRREIATERLILNGDVFDSIDFRRLRGRHWDVLSELRRISKYTEVVWVTGNHDGPAEFVSHLLGVECVDDYVVESGGRRVLFLHGHQFDGFIARRPLVTWAADRLYRIAQRLDRTHGLARFLKRQSKTFLRSADKIRAGAVARALARNCDVVCCGHTHLAAAVPLELPNVRAVSYYNSGCWTEQPCHYLTLGGGEVNVVAYAERDADRLTTPENGVDCRVVA